MENVGGEDCIASSSVGSFYNVGAFYNGAQSHMGFMTSKWLSPSRLLKVV